MSFVSKRQIIDTHCHPQMVQYDTDRDQVIQRALDAGVGMICVGVDLRSSQQAIALAEQYEGLWASVGLHPNDNLEEMYDQSIYEELAGHRKVVAIGEVGLDYYRTTELEKQKFQRERLGQQIELAVKLNKPLIIHCRDGSTSLTTNAHGDMLSILPAHRGVIHSFTGTLDQALLYIEKGYRIGLNGIITFARQYDDMVRRLPLDQILLETDAPYLTPAPYRGKRNEPVYIIETAKRVAELRGVSLENILDQTTRNAVKLFGYV